MECAFTVKGIHDMRKKITSNSPWREVLPTQLNGLTSSTKFLSVRLRTKWLWVPAQLQLHIIKISRLFRARSFLTFKQI